MSNYNNNLLSSSGNFGKNLDRKKQYIIFGDSHSDFFTSRLFGQPHRFVRSRKYKDLEINVYKFTGASMVGFGKKKSTLNVADKIIQTISENQNLDLLILKFGQVDVDIGYYYRLFVKQENINFIDFCEQIISVYLDFINNLPLEKSLIYILGINLPSIFSQDNAIEFTSRLITKDIKEQVQVQKIKEDCENNLPDIYERTNRSLIFNEILNNFCQKNNLGYDDFFKETINHKTGILKRKFHQLDDKDHHFKNSLSTRNLYRFKLQLISFSQYQIAREISPAKKQLEMKLIQIRQWLFNPLEWQFNLLEKILKFVIKKLWRRW